MNVALFQELTPTITAIELIDLVLAVIATVYGVLNVKRALDERRLLKESGLNGFLAYLQNYLLNKEIILLFVCIPSALFTYLQLIVPSPRVPASTYEWQQISYMVLSSGLTWLSVYKYSVNEELSRKAREYYPNKECE